MRWEFPRLHHGWLSVGVGSDVGARCGRLQRSHLISLFCLLLSAPLCAQQPATVIWNDPTPATAKPDTYTVTLEITVPATKATPCTDCASVPILLPSGAYTIRVVGTNSGGTSQPATTWTVIAQNLMPPAVSLTDDTGAVWTRNSSTARIFRNGVWVATGSEVLYLASTKRIYYHGTNGTWYEYHAPYWWVFGSTMPQ